jgi:hypothetical protein
LLENVFKQVGIMGMASSPAHPDDWKMLTLVGLADRLTARVAAGKNARATDNRKNRWSASKKMLRFILRKLSERGSQAAAIKGLRDMEVAMRKSLEEFTERMPDGARVFKEKKPGAYLGSFEPAGPETILKAYCTVALRVRSTATEAKLPEIIWHAFKHVVAPQLAAHLNLLERTYPQKAFWPNDHSAKGGAGPQDAWCRPSDLLRAVKAGELNRSHLQPTGPTLSLAEFKAQAFRDGCGYPAECAKAGILLRVLLQFCSNDDETWGRAQSMAGILLSHFETYDQQVTQGLGIVARTELSTANLADYSDLTSAAVNIELSQRDAHLDRKLNLPQTRRRILSYTPFITDPSSAELDADFARAVKMLRVRIRQTQDDEGARACMGYAYYMSRRCIMPEHGDYRKIAASIHEAAELTYDLMERAFRVGAPATQQIALRYLAGFCTNPRFCCTASALKEANNWVSIYAKSSPYGMTNLFKGRLAIINGKNQVAVRLYREMFLRALPSEFSDTPKRLSATLEDHEALAYLLPECYALVGMLLSDGSSSKGAASELQKQIMRAGIAYFGIECDWPMEAKRILDGFTYRKGLFAPVKNS